MSSLCAVLLAASEEAKTYNFFVQCMIKLIIRFSFCEIQNNQDLSKGYQPRL